MSDLKKILAIQYPIVQAPMLGVTTPAMVASVSNAGALGSLPVGGMSPDRTRELIREVKRNTKKPFAVNLFAHEPAVEVKKEEIAAIQAFLAALCLEFGIPFVEQDVDLFKFYYYQDQIEVLLDEDVPIVSFTFGNMQAEAIDALKEKGTKLIGTATSSLEARTLAQIGCDLLVVQGIEAGGHRGSFMHENPLPQVGLFSLLPQIADEITLPLLAAGGIYNKRTVKSAFLLGASGIQVGSLFIPAYESAASESYKQAVMDSTETSTVLTRSFSGKWARGVENEFIRRMHKKNLPIPYYTLQNQIMSLTRAYAHKHQIKDFIALWAGQSAGKSLPGTTQQIIERLIGML